jgi:septal ring factor EnvC (AmiA/AmiB activator)
MGLRLLFICLLFSVIAFAQQTDATRSDLEKRRASIMESIKQTQEQLELTKQNKNASMSQLRALQSKLAERQKLINNINSEVDEINRSINSSSQEITDLKKNLALQKIRYAQSVRFAYKNRASYNMVAFLFSSTNFNEAVRRLKYLKKYRDNRKEQAEQIRITQTRIEKKLGILHTEKSQKDVLRSAEEQQRMVILKETNEKDKVVKDLKGQEKQMLQVITNNQKSLRQLDRTIANIIQREIELARKREEEERKKEEARIRQEEEARRIASMSGNGMNINTGSGTKSAVTASSTSPTSTVVKTNELSKEKAAAVRIAEERRNTVAKPTYNLSLTPEVAALSNSFEQNRGRLPWPVTSGFVADGFGTKKHPVYNIMLENTGIDIQTSSNAQVRVVFGGVVTAVFFVSGKGQNVIVNHGRFFTVYSSLGNVQVKKGDNVTTKQIIGNVIANDNDEFLAHFELWKIGNNDKAVAQDPEAWIAR